MNSELKEVMPSHTPGTPATDSFLWEAFRPDQALTEVRSSVSSAILALPIRQHDNDKETRPSVLWPTSKDHPVEGHTTVWGYHGVVGCFLLLR